MVKTTLRDLTKHEENSIRNNGALISALTLNHSKIFKLTGVVKLTYLNGTSRSVDAENHWEDNIPKTLQLAYFPIAGYSEHEKEKTNVRRKIKAK